jgi:hypothetical protein
MCYIKKKTVSTSFIFAADPPNLIVREYHYANFEWYEQGRVLEITFRGILQ